MERHGLLDVRIHRRTSPYRVGILAAGVELTRAEWRRGERRRAGAHQTRRDVKGAAARQISDARPRHPASIARLAGPQ